jgi:hypothetical protein
MKTLLSARARPSIEILIPRARSGCVNSAEANWRPGRCCEDLGNAVLGPGRVFCAENIVQAGPFCQFCPLPDF